MNIGINVDSALNPYGNGRYARNLIQSLCAGLKDKHRLCLYHYSDRPTALLTSLCRDSSTELIALGLKRISRLTGLAQLPHPGSRISSTCDLYHALRPTDACRVSRIPLVVTMHDLGHLRFPSGFSHVHSLLEKLAFRIVKRNATMIITPSEVVRREVISYFQIRPERVHAIHQGIEDRFFTAITSQSKEQARIKYKLPERYCLFLGHLNPRKNVKKLLKAYNILAGDRDIPPLVIAGGEGFNFSTELTSLSAAREKVIFPGYIDEADLPTILAGAAVFIFVPLYEGFGFPPLEAMAVGTPVVASAIPVLLETLSDAALFVDPMSPDSIAEGIHSLIATPSLWSELQHKGRQRAKLFSWATTATEVLRVYESLI